MRTWLRRFALLLFVIIWLLAMSFPFLAFSLAARGELQFGDNPQRHTRVFLVRGEGIEGVAVERTRPLPDLPTCARTTLTYLMWEGEGDNVSYCQCTNGTILTPGIGPGTCPP